MIPPRSILVAIDFSASSRVALEYAVRLARHCESSLHVVHGEDPMLANAARENGVSLRVETRNELCRFVSAAGVEGLQVRYHLVTGSGASCICNIGEREQVDVIVMGTRGMSSRTRPWLGSTAETVLCQSTRSVLVVPDPWVAPQPSARGLQGTAPVIAAVECSEPAMGGAAAACRLAARLGTRVEFVHVVPDMPVIDRWRHHAEAAVAQRRAESHHELDVILPNVCGSVPFTLRIETGPVAENIAASAAPGDTRHPLLVLGRRNRASALGPPGATSYRVLTLAQMPTLLYLPER